LFLFPIVIILPNESSEGRNTARQAERWHNDEAESVISPSCGKTIDEGKARTATLSVSGPNAAM
jgi:hypothetical protein